MSDSITVVEPAVDPNNRITFLLDWELTLKCNLDCDYCGIGDSDVGGHDNSTKHPPLDECLKTIDFMFKYVDMYMSLRTQSLRKVAINVYGGEALHHPNIVEILKAIREKYQQYQKNWTLTITTTTNAILSDNKIAKIIPLIDKFITSYHTGATDKQKQQFKKNLLAISAAQRSLQCVVLMHTDQELFNDALGMISWLQQHHIQHLPKQLDHEPERDRFNYKTHQVKWFKNLYQDRSFNSTATLPDPQQDSKGNIDLSAHGRACCGGRQLHQNQKYKSRESFIENQFPDWYCSVNHFFLYIKQYTGDIFVNKDCRMNFQGSVGRIGNLKQAEQLLAETQQYVDTDTMPIIQCKKSECLCGLCAPKAQHLDTYKSIMGKYEIPSTNLLH